MVPKITKILTSILTIDKEYLIRHLKMVCIIYYSVKLFKLFDIVFYDKIISV